MVCQCWRSRSHRHGAAADDGGGGAGGGGVTPVTYGADPTPPAPQGDSERALKAPGTAAAAAGGAGAASCPCARSSWPSAACHRHCLSSVVRRCPSASA